MLRVPPVASAEGHSRSSELKSVWAWKQWHIDSDQAKGEFIPATFPGNSQYLKVSLWLWEPCHLPGLGLLRQFAVYSLPCNELAIDASLNLLQASCDLSGMFYNL